MKQIQTKSKSFQRAIAKAISKKPLVRIGAKANEYFVRASAPEAAPYPVHFQRAGGGQMLASCLCPGGINGFDCYHVAAALLAHSAFVRAGLRQPAARRPEIRL